GLQMRENVVPSLTIAVNGFLGYEKNLFLSAVNSREKSLSLAEDMDNLIQSLQRIPAGDFTPHDLSRLLAVAENYPQLVSIESYKLLIAQIAAVENQVYEKRVEYNSVVAEYNTRLSTFPANAAGATMGFVLKPYFSWDKKPEWSFSADPDSAEPPFRMRAGESAPGD
ncbi:unnamed protein product, partial [marine sediment metagenome]